jgi:hypothetical protein
MSANIVAVEGVFVMERVREVRVNAGIFFLVADGEREHFRLAQLIKTLHQQVQFGMIAI